jgi:hypothetical protein
VELVVAVVLLQIQVIMVVIQVFQQLLQLVVVKVAQIHRMLVQEALVVEGLTIVEQGEQEIHLL